MKSLAEARIKRARAVELAASGRSYDAIAEAVGFSHRGSAHRAVFKALSEREVDGVEDLRTKEMARLERLFRGVWEKAVGGDAKAVDLCVKIIDQECKLMGLHSRADAARREASTPMLVRGPTG